MESKLTVLAIFLALFACCKSDTPANCTYEDIRGVWTFAEGERSGDAGIGCQSFEGPVVNTLRVELLFPNVAVDEQGNKGYWTIVYNQGFEVVINYRKYFAFSLYKKDGTNVTSICDATFPGWSHDILGKNWACYVTQKVTSLPPKFHQDNAPLIGQKLYKQDKTLVNAINRIQKSWTATVYPELNGLSMSDYVGRIGGLKSRFHRSPRIHNPLNALQRHELEGIPEEFDWRNVSGINYVSPVRNQGTCGSCYAFASMAMLESRLRIQTQNQVQEIFSPQDVVSCSEYSQGCEGGFPYLIAGKYGQDFGIVPEECSPYTGEVTKCEEKKCQRHYVADYNYVGGFYGGCNEELMKIELVKNGPIAVSFEVYDDFTHYKGGVYHHTGLRSKFNPFLITNHAVLAVGYGIDKTTGEKYWIVKNSWGEGWGETGFFRIQRGTNECSIESISVSAIIIP